eukprot:411229_1
MAAPAPAPLPGSIDEQPFLIPIPPPLSDKLLNIDKTDRFFVNLKQKSHGLQWIASCLEQAGLIEVGLSFLPHPNCVFLWIPREFAYFEHDLLSGNETKPCISFIPCQGLLADKTEFGRLLYKYYGADAWKITPLTVDCHYDDTNQSWMIPKEVEQLIESKPSNHVWITKSSFGALGSGVFLYCGNTVKSFEEFIAKKYHGKGMNRKLERQGYADTARLNVKSIIVQQYIDRPLLFNEKYKFDLRVYGLLATTNPCVLLYHIGKMRVCGVAYNDISAMDRDDMKEMLLGKEFLYGHLSNCKIQRKHDNYDHASACISGQTMLNDWDAFIRFMYHVAVTKRQFDNEWFEKYQYEIDNMSLDDMKELVNTKCCRLFSQVYSAFKEFMDKDSIEYDRPCQFMFHGNDIMIDDKGRFYFLEVNRRARVSLIGHQSIKDMTKIMLKEAIDIVLEIRELKLQNQRVDQDTPFKSVHHWIKCDLDYQKPAVERIEDMIHDLDKILSN